MQKTITTFLLCFILTYSFGQPQKKISTYLLTQFNKTLFDKTIGNNPRGVGLGLETFLNNKTRFKPTIELTVDIYLYDDKVLRMDPTTRTPFNTVRGMRNIFVGTLFNPTKTIYLSFVVGPSFIFEEQSLLGIKPSIGFFSKSQIWTGKISYINIFNRGNITKQDFGSVSLAIGLKLF